jgi:hypothetical protein
MPLNRFHLVLVSVIVLCVLGALPIPQESVQVLDPEFHHLGNNTVPDWKDAAIDPEATRLEVRFDSRANRTENTLALTHRDVNDPWTVSLNGQKIGELLPFKGKRTSYFLIAPGVLRDGENLLSIRRSPVGDDIVLGDIKLFHTTLREALKLKRVEVKVIDAQTRLPIPGKVTVTDLAGNLVELFFASTSTSATRNGIAYTSSGDLTLELQDGEYTFYATRGMEWGLDRKVVRVSEGKPIRVNLEINREVDTTGFVACDTHVHTYTFSGHGDASVQERLVTLAGEGVELAVATDHNHHTDYKPLQREMKLSEYFTPVTGNEVTTDNGHFNGFPLPPDGALPNHKEKDWVKLVADIRAKGAKVVVFNHPRWPENQSPFEVFSINSISGERFSGPNLFTFDALELANSTTLRPDPLELFRDWFSIFNHGEMVTAVG